MAPSLMRGARSALACVGGQYLVQLVAGGFLLGGELLAIICVAERLEICGLAILVASLGPGS